MKTNNSVNTILKIGIILGIIGSLLCFICVFLPNRKVYYNPPQNNNWGIDEYSNPLHIEEEWDYEEHFEYQNVLQFSDMRWTGLTVLGISMLLLISCIFIQHSFGIIQFIGLCIIGYLNYLSDIKNEKPIQVLTTIESTYSGPTVHEENMSFGYYGIYIGCGILFISAILLLASNLREKQIKGETYGN